MWRIARPFSKWVLPLRASGVVVFLYAFVRMLAAPDLTSLVIAISGSLLWQAGTAGEEHSSLYRRLKSTAVRDIMRTLPVRVRSWISVSRFRSEHPALGTDAFIITTQDGYDTGILTPEELSRVPEMTASHTPIGPLAHPLIYVHGLQLDDAVLEAFMLIRQGHHAFLPIVEGRDVVVGALTAQDIDRWLLNNDGGVPRALAIPAEERDQRVGEKLAA